MLKVDNRVVGQTGWGLVAEKSWDQAFIISLDRVRLAFVWLGLAMGYGREGTQVRADAEPHSSAWSFPHRLSSWRLGFTGGTGDSCVVWRS